VTIVCLKLHFIISAEDILRRAQVVVESLDPFEPLMPPEVTAKQALHFEEALAKGNPAGARSP
jgi:hypothetical protein